MDLQSDSDESDVDFVPDKNCSDGDDSVSEDIDETENDGVNEDVKKGKKRTKRNKRNSAAKKVKNENEGKSNGIENTKVEEKDSKKHEDDLWASFLNDPVESETSKEKSQGESSNSSNVSNTLSEEKPDELNENTEAKKPSNTDVSISNPGTLNNTGDYYISDKSRNVPISKLPVRSARGGLSSVLNKIGKNNKQSTLEKSKNDWNSFKRSEGIEEEISIHNRGREGYLERQDFLQRTDLRRFEIEKNLRATKRSNR